MPLISGSPFPSVLLTGYTGVNAQQYGQNANLTVITQGDGFVPGVASSSYALSSLLLSKAIPTISSGFGTGAAVVNPNGTGSFQIRVGKGGTATNGVIRLPAAAHGWNCNGSDLSTQSATVFVLKQIASTVTSATIANFNTTGVQAAWVEGDVLQVSCTGN